MTSAILIDPEIPRVPRDVVSRPRLTAMLDGDAPLTVLRGACGSGKTAVMAEWARSRAASTLWITVDEESASSGRLARRLLSAIGPACQLDDVNGSAEWSAVRDALRRRDDPVVIIIDDAALLSAQAILDVCRVLTALQGVRIIAAATRRTAFDSEGLGLAVDRVTVAPSELMFDAGEIQRLLGVSADVAQRVREATGGLAVAVHATARRGLSARGGSLLELAADAVEDYMKVRVMQAGYDPAMLETLVRVSSADIVDAALAHELSGDAQASAILDEAESAGFGAWSDADGTAIFEFVPVARILLRRELQRLAPDDVRSLRRTAAQWAVRRGTPFVALRLAVEGDDLALASYVVMAGWSHLLEHHGLAVIELLGDIPLSRLREEPLVVMLLAICFNASRLRRLRGLQLFRVAIAAANSKRNDLTAIQRIFIWTAESAAFRLVGMSERSGQVAVRALRLISETPESEWEAYAHEMPVLCGQLGVSLYYSGHSRQAIDCFTYAAALASARGNNRAFNSLAMLGGIHALNGDLPEARHYVDLIRNGSWSDYDLDGYRGTFFHVAEAILALEELDAERAAAHVDRFRPHRDTTEHWVAMALVESLVALHSGRPAVGLIQLDSFAAMRGREGQSSAARHRLSQVRALLQLAQGDVEGAKAVLKKDAHPQAYETLVERARVALVEDRPWDTLRMLTQADLAPRTSRHRAEAAVLKTAALLRTVAEPVGREGETLSGLLADRGLLTPITLLPPKDIDAVKKVLGREGRDLERLESVLPEARALPKLTGRERVVLSALVSGASLTEVASELSVSPNTVKTQLRSIYRKLGVAGRNEAVALALAHDLLVER